MIVAGRLATRASRRLLGGRRLRATLIAMLVSGALVGGWLLLRDSPLVSVDHVKVTGTSGPDAARIRSALISSARSMTTLDVNIGDLRLAVAPYSVVKALRVTTQFPHGLRIQVIEQIPIAVANIDGRTIAVAADGTLLRDADVSGSLPTIPVRLAPGGPRLSESDSLNAASLLGAAPYPMLARISQVATVAPHGLVVQFRSGPNVYFGDTGRLAAKWQAAAAVLADPSSAAAGYIDVTDPARPVAGATAAASAGQSGTATAGAAASAGQSGTATAGAAASSQSQATTTGGGQAVVQAPTAGAQVTTSGGPQGPSSGG
jgi:cell division protein FtsQ